MAIFFQALLGKNILNFIYAYFEIGGRMKLFKYVLAVTP